MPKLIVAAGSLTVMIKDDRAEMDKPTLKAWKKAALEILEGAVANFMEPTEENPDD
jgi:hypothetical protein